MRKTETTIPEDVKAFLRSGSFSQTNVLHFSMPMTHDRKLYEGAKEVLGRYNAPWKSGKIKAHIFASDDDRNMFLSAIESGVMIERNAEDFYATPEPVASDVCRMVLGHLATRIASRIKTPAPTERMMILEPSCGDGALGRVVRHYFPLENLVGIEVNTKRAAVASNSGVFDTVLCGDFLTYDFNGRFDAVVMNPPFRDYGAHVLNAWRMLKAGGVLGAVLPGSFPTNANGDARKVREQLPADYTVRPIEYGAFNESGTGVSTCLVVAVKREA